MTAIRLMPPHFPTAAPNTPQIPGYAQPVQHLQRVVSNVHLPPAKSLLARVHELVMVVVPAFAQRDDGEDKVIAAVVGCVEAPRSPQMRHRIDGECPVKQQNGRDHESPHKSPQPAAE